MFNKNGKFDAEAISVGTTKDLDALLAQMLKAESRLQEINQEITIKLNDLKSKVADESSKLANFVKTAEAKIEEFCTAHRDKLFENTKSLKLVNGEVGFRVSKAVEIADDTLAKLQELNEGEAIETKLSVRKTVLAKWSEEELQAVNAQVVQREKFYYKLFAVQATAVTANI